jgi:hypothetical protein
MEIPITMGGPIGLDIFSKKEALTVDSERSEVTLYFDIIYNNLSAYIEHGLLVPH